MWQKNSEQQPFLPWGIVNVSFFVCFFFFPCSAQDKDFWPLGGASHNRDILQSAASSALGLSVALILLRAERLSSECCLCCHSCRDGAASSFSPSSQLFTAHMKNRFSSHQWKSIALSSSTLRPHVTSASGVTQKVPVFHSRSSDICAKCSVFLPPSNLNALIFSCHSSGYTVVSDFVTAFFWSFIVLEMYAPKWNQPADI